MPIISYFLGISIYFRFHEHNPPHFHAVYAEYEMTVDINTWQMKGNFPTRGMNAVLEWAKAHEQELIENWNIAQNHGRLKPIKPLE